MTPPPGQAPPPARLRHPAEVPFFIVTVLLNVIIIAVILLPMSHPFTVRRLERLFGLGLFAEGRPVGRPAPGCTRVR